MAQEKKHIIKSEPLKPDLEQAKTFSKLLAVVIPLRCKRSMLAERSRTGHYWKRKAAGRRWTGKTKN
jgi:hypothetical protein